MTDHFSRIINYPKCLIDSINFDGFERVGHENEQVFNGHEQIGHEDKQVVHENEKVCQEDEEIGHEKELATGSKGRFAKSCFEGLNFYLINKSYFQFKT
jgi:hypothetical protein